MKNKLCSYLLLCFTSCFATVANSSLIGSSAEDAGLSAYDILLNGGSTGDGLYWIDSDGYGGNEAFLAYADMTTDGGGWTLGVNSFRNDTSQSADMVVNTGVVGYNSSHTRNLENLAVLGETQIRHVISNNGSVVFDGYYTGNYHGILQADESLWTINVGNIFATFGNDQLGKDWSTVDNDVDDSASNCAAAYFTPWYYGNCWISNPASQVHSGPYANQHGYVDSWRIFVRGEAYDVTTSPSTGVPEPSTFAIFALGMIGLASRRLKKRS